MDPISRDDLDAALTGPWRVGSSVGRTIYWQPDGDHKGVCIGCMDYPELAARVVALQNASLRQGEGSSGMV